MIKEWHLLFRRASCGYVWNTPEAGPCVLRPVAPDCPDNPLWDDPQTTLSSSCWSFNEKETDVPSLTSSGVRINFSYVYGMYCTGKLKIFLTYNLLTTESFRILFFKSI